MQKRNFSNTGYMRHVFVTKRKFGEKGSLPIDQTPSKRFNIDPTTGRPMSDVQKLCKMQNDLEMQAVFASLPEFKTNYLPSDVKDSDALKFMCPRLAQLPSELLSYRDGLNRFELDKAMKERAVALAKQKEENEKALFADLKKSLETVKE